MIDPYGIERYTAFQLLNNLNRIPKSSAVPVLGQTPYGEFYYYTLNETFEVDTLTKLYLKHLYIEKYHGWEKVDLETCGYDGKIWWNKGFTINLEDERKKRL